MRQDRACRVQNEERPAKSDTHFSSPPTEKDSQCDGKEWRHDCPGEIECILTRRCQHSRDCRNQIIERRGRVGRSSDRKILKIVSPDDRAGTLKTNPCPGHPRITVGIDEVNLSAKENVAVIRAARHQNQRADENNFPKEREMPQHAPLKSAIYVLPFKIFVSF